MDAIATATLIAKAIFNCDYCRSGLANELAFNARQLKNMCSTGVFAGVCRRDADAQGDIDVSVAA
jgi:hypothetical protein